MTKTEENLKEAVYTEKAEWITPDKCVLQVTELWPSKQADGSYATPTRKSDTFPQATMDDLKANLAMYENARKEEAAGPLEKTLKKRQELGKKPVMTAELVRLRKNLREIRTYDAIEATEMQIEGFQQLLKYHDQRVEQRKATIAGAPKPAEK